MILHRHLQVNSEFFYANKLDLSKFESYIKTKLKFKKYSQDDFDTLIEGLVFEEKEQYIFIKTKNNGEFLLSSIHCKTSKDDAINYLKLNAKNQTVYLFDNVDYFSYGRFAVASNEKIERYLAFNCEATDDENVVDWIGKPHKWEYETHTFYSKKRLEDFEMSFDSDTVCEMAEYYLPFITEDLEIKEIFVFSKEPIEVYKPNNKKNQKPKKPKFNTSKLEKIFGIFNKNRIQFASVTLNVTKHAVVFSNCILRVLTQSKPLSPTDKILSTNKTELLWVDVDDFKTKFLSNLITMVEDITNAKESTVISARETLLSIDRKISNYNTFYIHIFMFSKKKFKLVLTSKQEDHDIEYQLGNKFNLKLVDKILKLIDLEQPQNQ